MSLFVKEPSICGLFLLKNFCADDLRGRFLKIHQANQLPEEIANLHFRETFISTSQKNVLRGMHFQLPPHAVEKLVTVIRGNVLDVIFDMRKQSPTFGKIFSIYLGDNSDFRSLFIPSGCAHGFLALEDQTEMLYQTTCEFHPASDSGFNYNSFGFNWQIDEKKLILSDKDKNLKPWLPEESVF